MASIELETSGGQGASGDEQLVEAALAGNRDAFGALVLRYQDRLFNTLLRILGTREDAADAVQEAFLQAYRKLESFRGSAKFYTWLYRIAINVALSGRRRRRTMGSLDEVKDLAGAEPVDGAAGPADCVMGDEQAAQVHAALAELASEHRQILVLREMEGCSYESIAEILELPVGTVRSRLFRARMQLRERLSEILGDEVGSRENQVG